MYQRVKLDYLSFESIRYWRNKQPEQGSSFVSLTKEVSHFLIVILCLLIPVLSYSQVGHAVFPSKEEVGSLNTIEMAEVDTPIIEPLTIETVEAELAYLKEKYRKDYKVLIGLDNHYTAFFGQNTHFWGAKLGLELFQGYRMGFGAYYMPKKIAITPVLLEGAKDTTYRKFSMHYYNTFMEFIFIRNFRWELALPFSLGYGIAEVERWQYPTTGLRPTDGKWIPGKDIGMFVGNFPLNAHYKIFSWVGLGFGIGWRQMIGGNEEVQRNMSGATLAYKIKIFPHYLYRSLFKKEKILEEKGDYRWKKYMKKNLKRLKGEMKR